MVSDTKLAATLSPAVAPVPAVFAPKIYLVPGPEHEDGRAFRECVQLALSAIQHALRDRPVECGRELARMERVAANRPFGLNAFLVSGLIEDFAQQRCRVSRRASAA